MKYLKSSLLILAFAATSFSFFACSNADKNKKQGKEYTSAYVCPMHCEGSGSDEAGICPVCEMDYIANKEHKL